MNSVIFFIKSNAPSVLALTLYAGSNVTAVVKYSITFAYSFLNAYKIRARTDGAFDFMKNMTEFKSLVEAIRDTEKTLGKVDYSINEKNRKFARSLYVVKDIKKGEKFTSENIRSIRPANGLHPKYYEEILGKTAKIDLPFSTPLKIEDFE